ncbi:MAG: translation initiation factor IF-2 [Clostridiaceae bacterium]|nr:MAG: translation initiation factor IF-2 [Clostridiaceae bacterium]
MRIYDIARSLQEKLPDLKSKDLVALLQKNGFEVKSTQSSIEDDAIGFLLKYYQNKPAQAAKKEKAASTAAKTKETAPKAAKEAPAAKEEKKEKAVKEAPVAKEEKEALKAETKSEERKETKATVKEEKREENKKADPSVKSEEKKASPDKEQDRSKNASRETNNNRQNNNTRNQGDNRQNNRDNRNGNRQGSYNRDNRNGNRQGGYNRDNNGNRQGGYNRDNNGNRQGGYNRDNSGNRQGGYNRDNNGNRQGGYNRDNKNGNRRGGNDSRRMAPAMDVITPEVKQSRQQRANKDSRSAKQRHGKDRNYNNYDDDMFNQSKNRKKKDPNRKGAFIKPEPVEKPKEPDDGIRNIILPEKMTIKELADIIKVPASTVIKNLFLRGEVVTLNHEITYEEGEEIALEYNCIAEMEEKVDVIAELLKEDEESEDLMEKRPPVVCVMGHVDHGKTSLLDAIREAHVTDKEAGGITQHIGAYVTEINGEKITFLDTPGHEAFTSMRMRGAQSTDIAILVVAADDGVMPQTIEAINHAKAAGVEIIVAVNKIDKPSANVERVKQELVEYGLVAEDWGGDTVFVPVSAHTKEGIDQLLEMIILTAEVSELKANPNRKARGVVIEAQLDKGRGPVATVLVQKGTLHVGDNIAVGAAYGKIRAMMNSNGQRVKEALPSTPVEILGLHDVPDAGEIFMATDSDKEARNIAETYISTGREKLLDDTKSKLTLDGLFSQIQAGNIKELNLIVKADVQGSVEAVKQSLMKLSNEEVAVRIIHAGVGAINESDVSLASASNAIIIGFNVRPDNTAKETAEREKVDVRLYRVIYNAIEDIEAAMKGMLDPEYEEKVIGHAEVRQTFKASGVGVIAGSYVLDGKFQRGCKVRISREGEQIFEGNLASLKRFKDDVKEVAAGYECGLVFENFNDIKVEDQIEAYIMVEVPR